MSNAEAVDLTGGLDDEREFVFAEQPNDPEMRESVNCWLWDNTDDFGMPRMGIEAVADQWDTHDNQVNVVFADGRVFNIMAPGAVHNPLGADGRPRILGAGPVSFELVEPFRHWRLRIDGTAIETSTKQQIEGWVAGESGGNEVPLRLEVDIRHVVPPWETGGLTEEAAHVMATQEEGDLMGGPRFEQLFRATGTFEVAGETRTIDGGGLRIRRAGIRRLTAFWGHAWQSAVFPSGRAFGYCTYPQRKDGKPTFNEGFLFEGTGKLIPARVLEAPWLRKLQERGEAVPVVLETADGATTIHGETILSTFKPLGGDSVSSLTLQQAVTRYTWDGESANGMLERSSLNELVEGRGGG